MHSSVDYGFDPKGQNVTVAGLENGEHGLGSLNACPVKKWGLSIVDSKPPKEG